jgi:uncharacterized delta-60 repeat protein
MNSRIRIRSKRAVAATAAVLALGAASYGAAAGAGVLAGFGQNGRVQTAFAGKDARADGTARYGKDRLVLAGQASHGTDSDIALARYLANGKLDRSFGNGGKVVTDLGGDEQAADVAVDSKGRIVVAGYSGGAPNLGDALVARYLADGTLDDSFGTNGIASPGSGGAWAVAVDSEDRVVISGAELEPSSDIVWFVERLTADGDPDNAFGDHGRTEGSLGAIANIATDVTLDASGRVVFAGCGDNERGSPNVFAAVRLLGNGIPDASFGDGGTAKVNFGSDTGCPNGIAVDHRGRIVLGGARGRFVRGRESGMILVARLKGNGTLDPSFSGNGKAGIAVRNSRPFLGGIVVDGRNRVVLAGQIIPSDPRQATFPARFLIAGLTAAGRIDRRIDGDGQVAFRFGPDKKLDAYATSLVLRRGAIYAGGYVKQRNGATSPRRFAALGYRPSP